MEPALEPRCRERTRIRGEHRFGIAVTGAELNEGVDIALQRL